MIRVSFIKFGGCGGGELNKVLLLLFRLLWLLWLGSILFSTKNALFPPTLLVVEFTLLSLSCV